MRELAIDFGTSNTVAAARIDGGPERLLAVDGWPVMPSAVWLSPDGTLVVGRDAERQARLDPARFEPNPKRRIDEVDVLLGDTVVAVVDLIAAVLARVFDEARRELDGAPDRLVLTHPAGWGAIRVSTLASAARRAGSAGILQLLPEPVAAAAHFAALPGRQLAAGQALAVFDLGGGTVDTAVVSRTADGWQVLAEAGLADVGGRDLDQLLLEHIGRQLGPDRPEWRTLLRPSDPASRRAARALADDIRAAKEALSRYPQADVPLPPPLPDMHVTRAELEALVRPRLERTAALLSSTIAVAGLTPASLAGVYLVGGGSRMPLVAQLIAERVGVLPVAVESPESSVVLGALSAPPPREATDPRVLPPVAAGPERPFTPTRPLPAFGAPAGRRRRRGPLVALTALGLVLIAAVAAVVISQLGGPTTAQGQQPTTSPPPSTGVGSPTSTTRATTETGGPLRAPDPVPVDAAAKEQAFAGDTELRAFAGAAVDRALNCIDPLGTAKANLGLRTQVQCVYRHQDNLYYASFLSADNRTSCEQVGAALALTGSNLSTGTWEGGGRSGTWQDVTLSAPSVNHVTFYVDSGASLCGLVEGDEARPLPLETIHQLFDSTIRPGS